MSLRFKGHYIVDEEGDRVCIPYKTLKRLCINSIPGSLSSFEIIKSVVKDLTGKELSRHRNTESELFLSLEKAIRANPIYKSQLAKENKKREQIREKKQKYCQYFGNTQHYIAQEKKDLRDHKRKGNPWY